MPHIPQRSIGRRLRALLLLGGLVGILPVQGLLRAEETFTTRINGLAGLTIAGDTDFSGPVWIGRLAEDSSAKGFKIDVFQDALYYEEVYHEGTYVTGSEWVEEGYYQEETTSVDVYDWVDYGYWTPDELDENGNVINAGYYVEDWRWEIVGMDTQTNMVWVSTGGHYEPTDVWQDGYYESVPHYGAPEARFTGTRSNTLWTWSNPSSASGGALRALMHLSSGGLSMPAPGDTTGSSRALLTHSSLEQSHTSPAVTGPHQHYGSRLAKNKIETWSQTGTNHAGMEGEDAYTVVENKNEAELNPVELSLSSSESSDGGATMVRTTTTITATSASFAGSVGVKGVLRVQPAGDLTMGPYTSGAQP